MKVALCFWGLTRSLKFTIDSIKECVFKPLQEGNIEYKIFLHTFTLNGLYQNPRANETNITLDFDEYKLLNPDFLQIDNQDQIKHEIKIEQYHTLPDPWDSGYSCLDNFVCAMFSKKQLGLMVKESDIDFDYIVYLRPDVKFINKFDIRYFNLATKTHVCTPNFHLFPKLNDRFCLLQPCHLEQYSGMFNYMYEYSCIYPLHSERFQYYMMVSRFKWNMRYIPIHFNRVRANGLELPDTRNYYRILKKKESSFHKMMNKSETKIKIHSNEKKYVSPLFKLNK